MTSRYDIARGKRIEESSILFDIVSIEVFTSNVKSTCIPKGRINAFFVINRFLIILCLFCCFVIGITLREISDHVNTLPFP